MAKIVFYSDTHLGFDYPIRPRVHRQRRGDDFFANHEFVLQYAKEIHADLVLHGGDLFFRSKIPQLIVDKVYESLLNFTDAGIPLLIVPGNHERARLPSSILLNHPNIYIFHQPKTFHFQNLGITISGFPYINDIRIQYPMLQTEFQASLHNNFTHLLVMHQIIEGATVGPGNFTFRSGEDVIQIQDIDSTFDAILCGHVHRKQILNRKITQSQSVPLVYCGSIERTSFAEMDEEKGFYVISIEGKTIQFQWHPLPTRPMIDITLVGNTELLVLKQLTQIFSHSPSNAIFRIRCNNPDSYKFLTSTKLAEIIPPSMNYHLANRPNHDQNS